MNEPERACSCGGQLTYHQGSLSAWYQCLNCGKSLTTTEFATLPFREIASTGEPKPYNTDKFKFKWKLIQP